MSIAEKQTAISENNVVIADNMQKVYKAGQDSMVDPDKIIPKKASGNPIYLDDVSEIPHDVGITLTSDSITDFSDVNVTVCGKNLLDIENGAETTYPVTIKKIDNGFEITNNSTSQINMTYRIPTVYSKYCVVASWTLPHAPRMLYQDKSIITSLTNGKPFVFTATQKHYYFQIILGGNHSGAITFAQFEKHPSPTEYKPYTSAIYNANADGSVDAIKYMSPNMTVWSDSDVDISVDYNKSYGYENGYNDKGIEWFNAFFNGISSARVSYARLFAYANLDWFTFPKKITVPSNADLQELFYSYYGKTLPSPEVFDCSAMTPTNDYYGRLYKSFSWVSNATTCPDYGWQAPYQYWNTFTSANFETIEKLRTAKHTLYKDTFTSCPKLKNITFEGEIGQNIDFTSSPLSVDSMKNVIEHLSDYSTESTGVYTVGFSEGCWTALEADSTAPDGKTWRNYVETTLGWLT